MEYTNEEILELVNSLIDLSYAAKIKNDFIEAFKNNTVDGTLKGKYNIFGAKSFRLSSSNPNLLNTPSTGSIYAKPIKRCFEAKPGYVFCMVDYSALEDRVIANLSKDENKCSIFTEGLDGHCLNSYYYFKEEIEAILPREENEDTYDYVRRYKREVDNGNKELKAIRQRGKGVSFSLAYGAYPKKVANKLKQSIEVGKQVFDRYHNELYKDVSKMRDEVLKIAKKDKRIHLGLGCFLYTDNADRDIRTLANATCQYWSILTLLTINKINSLIKKEGLTEKIKVVSSIYDSIYFHVINDPNIVKWLNDTLIPIMTKDFIKGQIVHNEAELECGFNWADTVPIPNNASLEEVKTALEKAIDKFQKQS